MPACLRLGQRPGVRLASVRASGSASVQASGSASVRASGSASVRASGSASVRASGSASVRASGSASVQASGSASVRAYGSASVRAYGSASVRAYGSASVQAYGSASVRAYDSASVQAYDSASVQATPYVSIDKQPTHTGLLTGGVVIQLPDTSECDVDVWCSYYGLTIDDGTVIVYKAVDQDLMSGHCDTPYPIGETVTAEDYQPTRRCGEGLHFGPTPRGAAANSVGTVARYLACRIKVAEAVALGDKIKSKSCDVLYEANADGERIEPAEAAVKS